MINSLREQVKKLSSVKRAKVNERFFKTGKGQYGEGDLFTGLTVPLDIQKLLESKIHEERLIALLILVENFDNGNERDQKKIFDFYLKSTKYVNNWDLVDSSADKIVGGYLISRDRSILLKLAKSKSLWDKRIAMVATYQFIKIKKEYKDTFKVAVILLNDQHDLIHKAVGWMLREVGKQIDQNKEEEFLKKHCKTMPRTMLRYAIERFDEKLRRKYLLGEI